MKTKRILLKKSVAALLMCSMSLQTIACTSSASQAKTTNKSIQTNTSDVKIQVAILLDTSSSMNGLIDQAKSRLWQIVNTLSSLKYEGKDPILEIALYEYGNDNLNAENGYVRKVTGFTTDLDYLSEKLFALSTNGGLEYCGTVIQNAHQQLDWSSNDKAIKLMYIAGNEGYDQGKINFREASSAAVDNQIFINTIYCGDKQSGIRAQWQDGAVSGKGKYFNIDHNGAIRHIATPYDDRIAEKNSAINSTYVSYTRAGSSNKSNQSRQDANASSMSKEVYAERIVSKSKSSYKNESWDLVDAVKVDKGNIKKVDKSVLPSHMQGMSDVELEAAVAKMDKERATLQKEIAELAKQREAYIQANKDNTNDADDLGSAITKSILELAYTKNYTYVKG